MQNIILLLLILHNLGLASCVKQKNCDCGTTGTWHYLEEPYYLNITSGAKKKIVAHIDDTYTKIKVTGNVPKELKTFSPIAVNFCADNIGGTKHRHGGPGVYTLKCIEPIN
jgi:hypothetical protein